MNFDFFKHNKTFIWITIILVSLATLAILVWGLKLGIDFQGGTVIEYKLGADAKDITNEVFTTIKPTKLTRNIDTTILLFEPLSDEEVKSVDNDIQKLNTTKPDGSVESLYNRISTETISSEAGVAQSKNAFITILLASLGIVMFLAISFRKVPLPFKSWEFGFSAVTALVHDAIIVLGVFALLGHLFNVHIDLLFVTAILTIIGFSVHDTIVVFDRLRENLIEKSKSSWKDNVNLSLNETIGRSLKLSFTAILVLLSMFLLGPESLRWFVGALLIGMISGTYSSIFVAVQLLSAIQDLKKKK